VPPRACYDPCQTHTWNSRTKRRSFYPAGCRPSLSSACGNRIKDSRRVPLLACPAVRITSKVGDVPFDIETPVRFHLVDGNAAGLAGQLLRRVLRRAGSDRGPILSIPPFFLCVLAPWRDIFLGYPLLAIAMTKRHDKKVSTKEIDNP